MKKKKKKKILFIGLGLISGSLFKNIIDDHAYKIYVLELDPNTIKLASLAGATILEDVCDVANTSFDFICLGLYPRQNQELILNNVDLFENQKIFDVAGLQNLWDSKIPILKKFNIEYIATHPMCGREVSGYQNSVQDLFVNKNIIINSFNANYKFIKFINELYSKVGGNIISDVDSLVHDQVVTYTSQLPHVISLAYTKMLTQFESEIISNVSANSFQEFSRISNVNEQLWVKLFIDNNLQLEQDINQLIENLQLIKKHISSKNNVELTKYLLNSKKNINLVNKS